MKSYKLFLLLILGFSGCTTAVNETPPEVKFEAYTSATPPIEQKSKSAVPIVELNTGGLMGGAKDGQWMSAKEIAGDVRENEDYQIYGLENSAKSLAKGSSPVSEPPCENFYEVKLKSESNPVGIALGTQVSWNPVPRPVKTIDVNSPVYQKIVAELLAGKGLTVRDVKIKQIFQTDLDGDGTDEIILTASSFKKGLTSRADIGDYSFVLMRKVINEKAENTVLAGDFVVKAAGAGAPAEYKISGIADLNGDGKAEIVIYAKYYEGEWAEVFELSGDKAKAVEKLKIACGS